MYQSLISLAIVLCVMVSPAHAKRVGNLEATSGAYIDFTLAEELGAPVGTIADITASPSVGAVYFATDGYDSGDCSVGGGSVYVLCAYDGTDWISQSQDAALAALSKTLAGIDGTVVDAFIYDTSKDSDGGAWRKRTQNTSWYKETLNTATRGATREFPAVALIVAETDTVTIYDATDPAVPMWIVIPQTASPNYQKNFFRSTYPATGCSASEGVVSFGVNSIVSEAVSGVCLVHFITDDLSRRTRTLTNGGSGLKVSERSDNLDLPLTQVAEIVNGFVNDVVMTVLPDASIDLKTGLPVPTIAVATDGGVSVIDGPAGVGTVVDIYFNSNTFTHVVSFRSDMALLFTADSTASNGRFVHVFHGIPTSDIFDSDGKAQGSADEFYSSSPTNLGQLAIGLNFGVIGDISDGGYGLSNGLTLLKENPITPADGMVAYITSNYLSGWMQGDIKIATLADTTAETIGTDITTEHVTNGDFPTNTDGWIAANAASLSIVSNTLRVEHGGSSNPFAHQAITTIIGQVYNVSFDVTGLTAAEDCKVVAGELSSSSSPSTEILTSTGSYLFTFKATTTTTYIKLQALVDSSGEYADFDNVSVKAVQNIAENGEFSSDRAWSLSSGNVLKSFSGGDVTVTNSGGVNGSIDQTLTTVSGTRYKITAKATDGTGVARVYFGTDYVTPSGSEVIDIFEATASTMKVSLLVLGADGTDAIFDYVTVEELQIPDRSVNDNPLQVVGELTKTAVATGADLVAYSGFSATDYIGQPYNSDLDFGTGDFYVMGWGSNTNNNLRHFVARGAINPRWRIGGGVAQNILFQTNAGTTLDTGIPTLSTVQLICFYRKSGVLYSNINGEPINNTAFTTDLTNTAATLQIGSYEGFGVDGDISLVRMGAGAPSDEQIEFIYNHEKKLFEEDAACTLSGSTSDVASLSYDPITKKMTVTTDKVDEFQGFVRISDSTPTGTPIAVSTLADKQLLVTSSEATYEAPAINIMEPDIVVTDPTLLEWDYSSDTDFKIPAGYYPEDVYNATLKYARSDVTITYDGFNYWCTISGASAVYITGRRIQ